jgi:hypothetical protein
MISSFTRRELAEILLAAGLTGGAGKGASPDPSAQAGVVTSILLTEDAANLLTFSPAVREEWRKAIADRRPFVQLGALVPDAARLVPELARLNHPDAAALAAGALIGQAAGNLIRSLPETVRLSADVVVLKHACGKSGAVSESDLLHLLRAMLTRRMIDLHTLIPDNSDASGWLERLFVWEQAQDELLGSLAASWGNAAADMRQLNSRNFYNPDDQLIRLARALGRGHVVRPQQIASATTTDTGGSLYARALVGSCQAVRRVGAV